MPIETGTVNLPGVEEACYLRSPAPIFHPNGPLKSAYRAIVPPNMRESIWQLRHGFAEYSRLRKTKGEVSVDVCGRSLRFLVEQNSSYVNTALQGYEQPMINAMVALVKPDTVFIDIGAADGFWGFAAIAAGARKAHLFEPFDKVRRVLKENIRLNDMGKDTVIVPAAVVDRSGYVYLFDSGLHAPSLRGTHGDTQSKIVNGVSVDDYVFTRGIYPTIIKIDVEGAEALVLKGGRELFSGLQKPRDVFLELHPKYLPSFGTDAGEVWQLLKVFGYRPLEYMPRGGEILFHFQAV